MGKTKRRKKTMTFYNQKTRDLEELTESRAVLHNYTLGIERLYGFSHDRKIDGFLGELLQDFGSDQKDKAHLIEIVEDFSLLRTLGDEKEVNEFYYKICNLIMSHLFERDEKNKKIRNDFEFRLSVPKNISHLLLGELVKRDMVNYKLKVDRFAIRLKDLYTQDIVFEPFKEKGE